MNLAKHKIYRPTQNNIVEEATRIEANGVYYYNYLNTVSIEEKISSMAEALSGLKIKDAFLKPSKIDVDYKNASYKIQLNKVDWDKVFDADQKPINYEYVKQFKERIKHFYD
jgi:hypothetical protein